MDVFYRRPLAIIAFMALLAGCQREAAAPAPQPAASAVVKPVGAANDTPKALTDEVIARASVALSVVEGDTPMVIATGLDEYPKYVLISPGVVLAPDAEHRLLVAMGASVNEAGTPDGADDWGKNLGLYGFTLRQSRWQLTHQTPSIARGGHWKTGADLRVLQLVGPRAGIAVNYVECHPPGICHGTLNVLALSINGAKQVLSEPVHEDSDGWSGPCDAMVKETTEAHAAGRTDFFANQRHCFATDGQMNLQPRGPDEWPDIKLTFTGDSVQIDDKTFEVTRTSHAAELVMRYDGERYKPISGRNPLSKP